MTERKHKAHGRNAKRKGMSHREAGIDNAASVAVYPADILAEKGLTVCDIKAKGAWLWTLLYMWRDKTFFVQHTYREFGRLWGESPETAKEIVEQLGRNEVCDVETQGSGDLFDKVVTLKCRRLFRKDEARRKHQKRQEKYLERVKDKESEQTPTDDRLTMIDGELTHKLTPDCTSPSLSSSSSSSSSWSESKEALPALLEAETDTKGKMDAVVGYLKESHMAWVKVPEMQIQNTLRMFDDGIWAAAIEEMERHYAGANMPKPCAHLQNYLEKHQKKSGHGPGPNKGIIL